MINKNLEIKLYVKEELYKVDVFIDSFVCILLAEKLYKAQTTAKTSGTLNLDVLALGSKIPRVFFWIFPD